MITETELIENGFAKSEFYDNDWVHERHGNAAFTFSNGLLTYVRNDSDYSGLAIRISTIERLISFLTFLR